MTVLVFKHHSIDGVSDNPCKENHKDSHHALNKRPAHHIVICNMAYFMSQHAFDLANKELGDFDIQLLDKGALNLNNLNQALDELARLKPLEKPALLKACAACITADKMVTITEKELFRAIADTLDCPMPPLVI